MTTFVLIHGGSSAGFYWDRVVPYLKAPGHAVVAADLPSADPSADFDAYADSVEAALGALGTVPGDLVVVGQSMGGFTAPIVAGRHERSRLILVAPMIPLPGESPGEYFQNVGLEKAQRAAAEEGGYDPAFDVRRTFLHDVPPEVVEELMAKGEPEQADAIFTRPFPLSAWPEVPTRVVAGTLDRMFPLELVERVARDRLGVEVEQIDSGHLPGFGHPEALARILLKDT